MYHPPSSQCFCSLFQKRVLRTKLDISVFSLKHRLHSFVHSFVVCGRFIKCLLSRISGTFVVCDRFNSLSIDIDNLTPELAHDWIDETNLVNETEIESFVEMIDIIVAWQRRISLLIIGNYRTYFFLTIIKANGHN